MISIVIISKDEASLDDTLTAVTAQAQALEEPAEVVVVDASDGRLDYIRLRHQAQARWVQFDQPQGTSISIPHQRNAGVRAAKGEIIVIADEAHHLGRRDSRRKADHSRHPRQRRDDLGMDRLGRDARRHRAQTPPPDRG